MIKRCPLPGWTLDSRMEPTLRVGVVLPADGMSAIELVIPNGGYEVLRDDQPGRSLPPGPARVTVEGERVVLRSQAESLAPAQTMVLAPRQEVPLERGAGVQLYNVLTGRGFHWQKCMNTALVGSIEFRPAGRHLLVVNELPMEQYLPGVISGEMSGECPLEFLKSQCLVARSWVLAHTEDKHPDLPIDRCNDDCCQRYHGTNDLTAAVLDAVHSTRGRVLVDRARRIIDTNYSKSCGGIIEAPEHVWSVSKPGQRAAVDAPADSPARQFFPLTADQLDDYLSGPWLGETDVFCSPRVVPEQHLHKYLSKVDEGGGHFRWQVDYSRQQLEAILQEKLFARPTSGQRARLALLKDLRVLDRGQSGRATALELEYFDPAGTTQRLIIKSEYAIRDALHDKFLYSSAFKIVTERDARGMPGRISLIGAGWGHGAGLCQIGALGMALKDYSCESILSHYFEDIHIHAGY